MFLAHLELEDRSRFKRALLMHLLYVGVAVPIQDLEPLNRVNKSYYEHWQCKNGSYTS